MKMTLEGLENLDLEIDFDEIIPEAIDAAMPLLVDATKNAIQSSIRHPDESTGDLIRSVEATPAKRVRGGGFYAGIRFKGKGKNGTRNGLKAAQMEYGNSDQIPAPFADRAAHFASAAVTAAVQNHIDKKVGK